MNLVCVLLSLLVVACGTSAAVPVFEETAAAQVTHAGDLATVDEPVLTVVAQGGSPLAFDLAALDRLRQVRATLYDPFDERDIVFSGVVMSEVLEFAGADERGVAHFLALDDYEAQITMSDIASSSALLATRQDGEEIPVEQGGPTRIVFPGDSPTVRNTDLWVWSIEEITVQQ